MNEPPVIIERAWFDPPLPAIAIRRRATLFQLHPLAHVLRQCPFVGRVEFVVVFLGFPLPRPLLGFGFRLEGFMLEEVLACVRLASEVHLDPPPYRIL